jgi:glycosyltransferase involved in cell wall biosynthesis
VSAKAPLVSVLVPSFDKAAYVAETLDSAMAQTLSDLELIVVDDGSRDASRTVLQRYEGRATIVYQANQGASAARTAALSRARGRYVQYLDADDLLLPHALADRVAALEHSGADVAYSDYQSLRRAADGTFARAEAVSRRIEAVDPDPQLACFGRFWLPPAALLYTRALTARLSWSATLPVIQDARYLFDAARAGARFVHVAGVSALYRQDADASLSRASSARFVRDVLTHTDEVAQLWRADGPLDERRRAALVGNYDYAARGLFRQHPELAERCADALHELGGLRPLGWPRIARTLHRTLGHRAALSVLSLIGRPAL